tara:strand:- start:256 stop:489 length:234 start_codon:yes stop_codon:yes gene_type:complete
MTTTNNYTRFNKSVLTSELKGQILDLISDRDFKEFKNELFGLFDGYLYNSIEFIADADLPVWKKVKLKLITLTIQGY